ncbi:natural killer cell receptor 2B4-like isoform X1 [Triplophysa dalaica]|uniref:natural killer cell receptor 2B4-like isoform X1 n=1 Tax=Triplophysa dalaica TaxID=1582913 RepID=UPI0024E0119C|nr:natural killer cell receptor 2B4-like isoform X1 [Triplophysa dalaica]
MTLICLHTSLQNMVCVLALVQLCLGHFNGVFGDEVKSVSVMEGENVTLHTDVTELHTDDVILWMFGVQRPDETIAEINREVKKTSSISEKLKNHVEIDDQTGSLIITNITTQHTGLYQVEIIGNTVQNKHFSVTVYAGLSVPVISRVSSQCSSSSSSSCCCVLCSVMNVSHDVSVSWYKGKSLLSSISVSDLNIRLSLPLEVEYQDTNTYRCVVNNPITNLTQHLHINQLCHMSSESPDQRLIVITPVVVSVLCVIIIIIIIISVYMKKRKVKSSESVKLQTVEMRSISSSSTCEDEESSKCLMKNKNTELEQDQCKHVAQTVTQVS